MRALPLVLLVACSAAPRAPVESEPAAPDDAARRAGLGHARDLTGETLAALRRGDFDALHSRLDPNLLCVAGGVHTSRTDALMALRAGLAPGKKHRVSTRAFEVVAARGGRSALAAGAIDVDGSDHHVSAVLAEVDGMWSVVALQLARPGRPRDAASPPASPSPDAGPEPPREVLERFQRAISSPAELSRQLADRRDVVAVLPGELLRGPRAIRRSLGKATWEMALRGRPRGALTPDGNLAWIAADVDVSGKSSPPVAHRALFIYEGESLIAYHLAVAVP